MSEDKYKTIDIRIHRKTDLISHRLQTMDLSQTQDMQFWYDSTCYKRADYLQHNLHIHGFRKIIRLQYSRHNERTSDKVTYKKLLRVIIKEINIKDFGLSHTSRIKTFIFKYISVPAKWIKTSRAYRLNIYTDNLAYARVFKVGND